MFYNDEGVFWGQKGSMIYEHNNNRLTLCSSYIPVLTASRWIMPSLIILGIYKIYSQIFYEISSD